MNKYLRTDILGKKDSNEKLVEKINKFHIVSAELMMFDINTQERVSDNCHVNCNQEMVLILGNGEMICFYDGEYGDVAPHMRVININKKED